MFSGIIEELGVVKSVEISSAFGRLAISASQITQDVKIGDSIAVNGACLTVTDFNGKELSFDLSQETIHRTGLSQLKRSEKVNLERSIKSDGRFSGHFVTGHIDGVGLIKKKFSKVNFLSLEVEVAQDIMQYLLSKGSVAVDGVSLTIVDVKSKFFTVSIIPYTKDSTTLGWKDSGKYVNIETDILGKYIHKFIATGLNKGEKISKDFLKEAGFI